MASPFLLRSAKIGFESIDSDVINSAKMLSDSPPQGIFHRHLTPFNTSNYFRGNDDLGKSAGRIWCNINVCGKPARHNADNAIGNLCVSLFDPLAGVMLSIILIVISFSILIIIKLLAKKVRS